MSLKLELLKEIEKEGYARLEELEVICKREGKKVSNGERRLRELTEQGQIYPKRTPKGYISGYHATFPTNPTTSAQENHETESIFNPLQGAMFVD